MIKHATNKSFQNFKKSGSSWLHLIIVSLFMMIAPVEIFGQTSGLIYKPASEDGASILDPNGDGYVSQNTGGFVYDDHTESEIPFVPIFQLSAEGTRDVRTGPPGGHTDLVGQYSDGKKTAFMYYDAANDALLFRVRLAKQSKASKGYSFLFNTDFEQFGPKATNFSRSNPGFQYEVVLETNFRISVYDWSSGSASRVWSSPNLDDYFQKSISYKHYGQSGDSGENGYFYDFYVPLDDVPAAFRNELFDDFRVTVSTITNAQRGISGVISDILGSGSLDLQSECGGGIGSLNCTEVDPTTITPDIDVPLYDGDTSISGRLQEADGSTVYIFVNNTQIGTASVNDFEWEITGITALAENDVVKARASTNGKKISNFTPEQTVVAAGSFVPCKDGYTETPSNVYLDIPNTNSGHVEGVGGTSEANATINLYDESFNAVSTETPVTADANGDWYYEARNPGFLFINSESSDAQKCESEYATVNAIRSDGEVITNKTDTPSITSSPEIGGTSISVQNNDEATATIYLYINEEFVEQASADSEETIEFTSLTAFENEDVIAARAKNTNDALSDRVYKAVSAAPAPPEPDQSEAPEIVGNYVAGSNVTVVGFSTEEAGTKIKLYVDGGEPVDSTEVLMDNTWELEVATLSDGDVLTATATAPQETESDPSAGVTVLAGISTPPTITSDLTIYSTEISGTSSASGTLTIYVDDGAIGTKEITGNWTFTDADAGQGSGYIQNELYQGATVTATLTESGKPESDYSNQKIVAGITSFSISTEGGGNIGTQVAGTAFDIDIDAREGADGTGDIFEEFVNNVLIYSVEAPISNGFRVTDNFTTGSVTHETKFDDGAEDVVIRALFTDNPEITGASNAFLVNNPN
ncbi:MAG: hypothetical protein WD381_00735, partial [Balneolaceae bacterium]